MKIDKSFYPLPTDTLII